jgi:hypothetical protein
MGIHLAAAVCRGKMPPVPLQEFWSGDVPMAAKTTCPISRSEFKDQAKSVTVKINDVPFVAEPREFSTGSLGWNINGKMTIEIAGKMVSVQVGMNLTVVGSKDLPKESP